MEELAELEGWEDVELDSCHGDEEETGAAGGVHAVSGGGSTEGLKRDRHGFVLTDQALHELRGYTSKYLYEHRRRVERWHALLGSTELLRANPGEYERLLRCEEEFQFRVLRQIRIDISRTFPNNPLFEEICGAERMERILSAYALRNPDVGYCQGMNYIVGFLLLVEEEEDRLRSAEPSYTPLDWVQKEERIFWVLVCIIEHSRYNKGYYLSSSDMFALKMDCLVLKRLTKELQPQVYARISQFPKCPIFMVLSASWFITLFIDTLPSEALIKVWDAYVLEGRVVLFRVAVALLRMTEDQILLASDVNIVSVIRERARSMYDCEELLSTAFGGDIVAKVTTDVIKQTKSAVYKAILASYQKTIGWWEYCNGPRPERALASKLPRGLSVERKESTHCAVA